MEGASKVMVVTRKEYGFDGDGCEARERGRLRMKWWFRMATCG